MLKEIALSVPLSRLRRIIPPPDYLGWRFWHANHLSPSRSSEYIRMSISECSAPGRQQLHHRAVQTTAGTGKHATNLQQANSQKCGLAHPAGTANSNVNHKTRTIDA